MSVLEEFLSEVFSELTIWIIFYIEPLVEDLLYLFQI